MAEDVELFMQAHKLSNSCLIGHSMGAKAAMAVALRHKVEVGALIPVDNAPVDAALKSDFGKYVQGMRKIQDAQVTKQSEADAILSQYEPSLPIRQFLLTNLSRDQADGVQKWRIPIKTLGSSLDNMADFPFKDPDAAQYKGQTLIVRGTNSHYVADEMLPLVGRFFPAFKSVDIEAGHWLISEKPEEFRKGKFCSSIHLIRQHTDYEQLWSTFFKTETDSPFGLEPRMCKSRCRNTHRSANIAKDHLAVKKIVVAGPISVSLPLLNTPFRHHELTPSLYTNTGIGIREVTMRILSNCPHSRRSPTCYQCDSSFRRRPGLISDCYMADTTTPIGGLGRKRNFQSEGSSSSMLALPCFVGRDAC